MVKKDGKKKLMRPRSFREGWNYIIGHIDNMMNTCKIRKTDEGFGHYDYAEHTIYIPSNDKTIFRNNYYLCSILTMILRNLFPDTRKVVYKDHDCYIIRYIDMLRMTWMFAHDIYQVHSDNPEKWNNHVDKIEKKNVEKYKKPREKINEDMFIDLYYRKKLNFDDISELTSMNKEYIGIFAKEHNFPIKRRSVHWSITKEDLFDLYYKQDFTIKEIADIYDTSYSTIWRKMDKYGFKRLHIKKAEHGAVPAFQRSLRKYFRKNKCYLDATKKMLEWAEENPDFPEYDNVKYG